MAQPEGDKHRPKLEEEFTLVKSKKGGRKKIDPLRNFHSIRHELPQVEEQCSLENRLVHMKKIDSAVMHISSSDYFSGFLSTFKKVLSRLKCKLPFSQIVCYGLGCFADCAIARYQLALLTCLKNEYKIDKVELFDPMFSSLEKNILTDLNFSVISVNEEGKRKVDKLTLFYMPHCSHQLANNLLYSNWNTSALDKCVIVSNSFKRVIANTKNLCGNEVLKYIVQIEPVVEEYDVENNFEYLDIFNDTAIHIFPHDKLALVSSELWTVKEEPTYVSAEFISISP